MRDNGGGLLAQLRRPPGGRDGRIMLLAQFLDRAGTGVWAAASVLYFTFVTRLDAQQVGLLLGVAAVAGIAGSPLAGQLAERFPLRGLLIWSHLLRLGAMGLVLLCDSFTTLMPVIALICLAERAAKTLEMLFATRATGERRSTYQALTRSAANAGYALGAGIAAIGLAVGTENAYRALVLANALSFAVTAALVWRTREPQGGGRVAARAGTATAPDATTAGPAPSPWRDAGYLRFVLLDIPMCLDDSLLNVGLPLWLVNHTSAPHAFVPAFLALNTVLVVVLQLRVSARAEGPHRAAAAVTLYGVAVLASCAVLAFGTGGGPWSASIALLVTATLVTAAELVRSVTSWELAVSLAPDRARASYLGVAGMAQSVQKSAGPLLLTGVVMATGPAGWLGLGAAVAGLSVVQRRACERRLTAMRPSGGAAPVSGPGSAPGPAAMPESLPVPAASPEPADDAAAGPAARPATGHR
ncbi:MFS transporter [Kitasatospora sp. NBC_00085]|uniref:MFS transporter n=1 Tax=unclassified Kitasatospora TaxID=2633591 RepID=UPI00324E981B